MIVIVVVIMGAMIVVMRLLERIGVVAAIFFQKNMCGWIRRLAGTKPRHAIAEGAKLGRCHRSGAG